MTKRRQKKRVLLVGLEYSGPPLRGASITTKGLCRPEIAPKQAAAPLYEYDVIIINPVSYSHFIFGRAGEHSDSEKELWDLKKENNDHDLDAAFDRSERQGELKAAIKQGTRVVFVMAVEKKIHFFGWRSLYQAYLIHGVETLATATDFSLKTSKKLTVDRDSHPFAAYFKQLGREGWTLCGLPPEGEDYVILASSPDKKALGLEIELEGARSWLISPPPSSAALRLLIQVTLKTQSEGEQPRYHGIFLSHTSEDKPFVYRLKTALNERGVSDVWVDEAEIMVGDSLIRKIEEAITKARYFGVVLSPRSVRSRWVKKELEIAMNMEIKSDSVIVLPLLLEKCEIPPFLEGKVYADFTSPDEFAQELDKLLRKLALTNT
jgi:hypothetical protein